MSPNPSFARGCVLAFAAALALLSAPLRAQEFPKATVKIIVPFTPGGATDTVARLMAQKLQEIWGQSVVVDYKPGAGTVIGADFVAKSAPDGYTIGLVNSAFTVNPSLRKKMPFDTVKDIRGVTQLGFIQSALVARSDAPYNTVREFVTYARQHPGKLTYGNSGIGALSHLVTELLKKQEGLDILTVPFKGGAQVMVELLGGRIDVATEPFLVVLPYIKDGRAKMLGTFGDKRVKGYEHLYPTIAEAVPGLSATSLLGFIAPAGTPPRILKQIQTDVARILAQPDIRKRLEEMGIEATGSTPEQFDAMIQSEIKRWAKVIADAHLATE